MKGICPIWARDRHFSLSPHPCPIGGKTILKKSQQNILRNQGNHKLFRSVFAAFIAVARNASFVVCVMKALLAEEAWKKTLVKDWKLNKTDRTDAHSSVNTALKGLS